MLWSKYFLSWHCRIDEFHLFCKWGKAWRQFFKTRLLSFVYGLEWITDLEFTTFIVVFIVLISRIRIFYILFEGNAIWLFIILNQDMMANRVQFLVLQFMKLLLYLIITNLCKWKKQETWRKQQKAKMEAFTIFCISSVISLEKTVECECFLCESFNKHIFL